MEQILNKLSEIEITAERIMEDADRNKAALSDEMEHQCKAFDNALEKETNQKIQEIRNNLEDQKNQEVTMLRHNTEKALENLENFYNQNHGQLSEDLFQQLLER